MRFRVLGPLRVRSGDGWVPVAAPQQRVVLAMLLADAGQVVSSEKLVDAVWPDRPPRRPVNTIAVYVMRIRRLVGDGVVVTRGGGYELVAGDGDVDAVVFERLLAAARREREDGRLAAADGRLGEALALWRGPVLADVPASASMTAWVAHLAQLRLAAEEDRVDVLVNLGRHAEVVGEALAAYQRARQVLLAELGLEPGAALRQVQRAILTDELPAASAGWAPAATGLVPAQLPADVSGFTGRGDYLRRLDELRPATDDGAGAAVVISAIAGTAGVGKTALALHWAHRVRDGFPDGQLYVNLGGWSAGPPARPVEVLARFLRALGVPPEQVPAGLDEAGALYRSRLAGQRMLVVLDNARDAGQVRPLLPASPGCLALVTSRSRLTGLVARDGATALTLDVLTGEEARALLAWGVGESRVRAEPRAAAALVRLCGHLPLAVRIAAANLSSRPHASIAEYAARLRRDRLRGLEVDDDPAGGLGAAFDLSYDALPADARRLFPLLGQPSARRNPQRR